MGAFEEFEEYVGEINDLLCVGCVLIWDFRTQMPSGGALTRGCQLATINRLVHERIVSDNMRRRLERAESEVVGEDPDSYRVRSVRHARHGYEMARRIPSGIIGDIGDCKVVAQQAWAEAREHNDFDQFAPHLERMVSLNRDLADAIGYSEHPYDAMLALYVPEMTTSSLLDLLAELKAGVLPLLERIEHSDTRIPDEFLSQEYPVDRQRAFGMDIARRFGYDLERGRLDESPHPFMISFTRQDVRITTRYDLRRPQSAIFGILHETGHALYEQGLDPTLTRGALACDFVRPYAINGTSISLQESQSRLWETLVGRSRSFWQCHFSRLADYFPGQLRGVEWEDFYRATNQVESSPVRLGADEIAYNLHILLRVEIEVALMEGSLEVAELPEAWNAKTKEYLGITPATDSEGVLQDMHWSTGYFGSFPTYSLGNVMAAQFFEAAHRSVPGLDDALAVGDYRPLLSWLTENIYRHGHAYSATELLQRTTGAGLQTRPYLTYLEKKYDEIYACGGRS